MRGRLRRAAVAASVSLVGVLALVAPATGGATGAAATLPSWIKPRLVVRYDEDLDYGYLAVDVTDTVTGVGGGVVHVTTVAKTVGLPQVKTYHWTCSASGTCPGGAAGSQFWVDPKDALASVAGQGVPFAYLGLHSYDDKLVHRTFTAGLLHYQNATGTIRYATFYDSATGLVLEHDELVGRVFVQLFYDG